MNIFHNKVIQLFVFLLSFGLCLSATHTIMDLWHRRDLVTNRQNELNRVARQNKDLEQQLREAQSDSYIERIARDKLGLVKDGETIVLLPQAQGGDGGNAAKDDHVPNWQKWWRLFF